jgi:hypothetical protein
MDKILIALLVLGMASYGAKTVVEDDIEEAKKNMTVESLQKAKKAADSVSAPIKTNDGREYDLGKEKFDLNKMYNMAQEEARHMMNTGDIEAFQNEIEEHESLFNVFSRKIEEKK